MRKVLSILTIVALAAALTASVAFGATKTVRASGVKWSPSSVSVKKGDTVRWRWSGSLPHNVKGPGVSTGTKKSGSASRRFSKAGTFRYVCTVHKGTMKMTVRVR